MGWFGTRQGALGSDPAAELARLGDAGHGDDIGGAAGFDLVSLRGLVHAVKGGGHFLVQPSVHQVDVPVKAVGVLDLLKVRDGHAPGVTYKVGDDKDVAFAQDLVGVGGGGTVGGFAQDLDLG